MKNQIKNVVLEHLGTWEDQSHNFIRGFAGRFGAEDVVVRTYKRFLSDNRY